MRRAEIIIGSLIVLAMVGWFVVEKVWFSSGLGEVCARDRDCGPGLKCVTFGSYCTRECETVADCGEGFTCGEVTAREHRGLVLDPKETKVNVCIPPQGRPQ